MNQDIDKEAKKIIEEMWTDGIFVSCGNGTLNKSNAYGKYYNEKEECSLSENVLFDIASVTKLLSLFVFIRLIKDSLIDIEKKVKDYSKLGHYKGLQEVYIYQLLNFSMIIETEVRLDKCMNEAEVRDALWNSKVRSEDVRYSDIGIIIATKMVDDLYGKNFFREYSKNLWNELGLVETYWHDELPESIYKRVQSYDSEYKYTNAGELESVKTPVGVVHDVKTRVLGASAHAGIFISGSDINKLCKAVLRYEFISKEDVRKYIMSNKYDSFIESNGQHFGLMCYKKTEDVKVSEVPFKASKNSIAISGYTGCYLLFDFDAGVFVFIGSNRIRNRLTTPEGSQISNVPYIKETKEYVYRKDLLRDKLYEEIVL